MPNLTFIGNSADDAGLPWVRDWLKEYESDIPSQILRLKHAEKGLLIYTLDYKAYVWAGSKLYDNVLATLHLLAMHPDHGCPFYCKPLRSGNIAIALDEDLEGTGHWQKKEDAWSWTPNEATPADNAATGTLLSPSLLGKLQAAKRQASALGEPLQNVENPTPRKGKKPPIVPN